MTRILNNFFFRTSFVVDDVFNPLDIHRLFDLLDLYFSIGKNLSHSSKKSLKKAIYDSVGSFLDSVDCQSQFLISQLKASRDFLDVLGQFCNSCFVMVRINWKMIGFII